MLTRTVFSAHRETTRHGIDTDTRYQILVSLFCYQQVVYMYDESTAPQYRDKYLTLVSPSWYRRIFYKYEESIYPQYWYQYPSLVCVFLY